MNSKDKRLRDETVRSCCAAVRSVSGREGGGGGRKNGESREKGERFTRINVQGM